MTQISALGEFGLIKRLTQDIELKNPETKKFDSFLLFVNRNFILSMRF